MGVIPKPSLLFEKEDTEETKNEREDKEIISFKMLAKDIIERQKDDKDTIIYVSGDRRNGKTTWGLKLLRAFIKEKKEQSPEYSWNWNDNFALDTEDAIKKYRKIPEQSFIYIDEGDEVASTGDANTQYQKRLIKMMNKVGERGLLCIINHPNFFGLKKEVRNMATLSILIPYRFKMVCAFAMVFGRNQNPLNDDKFAMDLKRQSYKKSKVSKRLFSSELDGMIKVMYQRSDRASLIKYGAEIIDDKYIRIPYPKTMFDDLAKSPTFLFLMRYTQSEKRFYDDYKIKVKKKIIDNIDYGKTVSLSEYIKAQHRFRTLLFNSFFLDGKKPRQLERLMIDNSGKRLISAPTIKRIIEEESAKIRKRDDDG